MFERSVALDHERSAVASGRAGARGTEGFQLGHGRGDRDQRDRGKSLLRTRDELEPAEATAAVLLTSAEPELAAETAETPVKLETITKDEFVSRISKNKEGIKYTVVDGWATYCPPCMENFPHLVEMHEKYGDQGLRVISVSFDDTSLPGDVKKAKEFLESKHAGFENYVFSGDLGETYEHFDVNAIPAVFVYGPDGKEIKRFTLDDPDNQFTYDEVEAYLKGLLSGKKAESEEK